MRALLPIDRNISRIDADSLSFLLETDDRELSFLLLVEQQRFDAAVQAMNERPRLHLEVVQPRLAAAGIVEGGEYSRKQLVTVLGDDLLLRIERATDVAIEHVDATVKPSTELIAAMYRAMK